MGFSWTASTPRRYDRTYTDRQLLERIMTYFRPEARKIGLVALMVVLNSLLDAALPILIATGLDRVVAPAGVD